MSASATVPEGYKQTEIGVFPKDWKVKKFGDIFDFKSTASNSRSDLTETDEAHYIHYGDIHTIFHRHLDISKKSTPRIDLSLCKNATRIRNGDWVMADASEDFSGICKAIEISGIDEDKPVVAGLHTFLLRDRNKEYSPGFKGHLGEAKFLHDQYVRVSVGLKVFGVTKTSLRDLLIPVPPKTQQTRIEEILTQADAQIQSFEHLIAKKRDIKQGTMQELLTRKTRLPGFSGDWCVKTLEEITICLDNLRVPLNERQRKKMKGIYPYCGANGIVDYIDEYVIDDDIILMAEDGGYFDQYAFRPIAYRITGKCWVNNHAHILKNRSGFDLGFIFYSLVNKNILRYIASGTRAKLNKSEMNKIEVNVPIYESEQKAIAEVLSDMDAEIAALEERLEKAKAIKQGMMQQLLTGKIRLVD